MRNRIVVLLETLALVSVVLASCVFIPLVHAEQPSGNKDVTVSSAVHSDNTDAMRVQGELRYRANCGRCHAAPRKFPPRMMATVLRHMRVRATITDEDMKLVLFYMTQ